MTDTTTNLADGDVPHILDGLIPEEVYAEQRGVSLRTCQRDRQLRQAPPHIVLGKRVYYRVEAVRAWLRERERHVERKASAPRAGPRR